jgi:hypothetical protein
VRQAIREEPNARHLLGVIAYQRGDATAAVDLIGRAAETLVNVGPVHANLGNALRAAGIGSGQLGRVRK